MTLIALQIGVRNQFVQILQTHQIARNHNHVVSTRFLGIHTGDMGVYLLQRFDVLLAHILENMGVNSRQHSRIIAGAVVVERRQLQIVRHGIQLVILQALIQGTTQGNGVHRRELIGHATPLCSGTNKAGIKARIMRHQHTAIAAEIVERLQRLFLRRSVRHHGIGDAGQLHNLSRNGLSGIGKGIETILYLSPDHTDGTNLRDALDLIAQTRSFDIKDDVFTIQRHVGVAIHRRHHIVDEIRLHAIQHLDGRTFLFQSRSRVHNIGESLHHTVIGNGYRLMSPRRGTLHQISGIRHGIHGGHLGVHVQFHALFLCQVLSLIASNYGYRARTQQIALSKLIVVVLTTNHKVVALFKAGNRRNRIFVTLLIQPQTDHQRAGQIRDGDGITTLGGISILTRIHAENLTPHRHRGTIRFQSLDGDWTILDRYTHHRLSGF